MRSYSVRGVSWPSILWTGLILCLLAPPDARAQVPFLRGDVNGDGQVSMADASMWGCILFCAGVPYSCLDTADVNDDGLVNVDDLFVFLNQLFSNKAQDPGIAPPFPEIGLDPTEDSFICQSYEPTPAAEGDDWLQLGSIRAAPGEQVLVPVHLTAAVPVNTIQLVVQYDPQVFAPLVEESDEEKAELYFAGTGLAPLDSRFRYVSWRAEAAGGILRFGQSLDLLGTGTVGPGDLIHVGNIPGTVLPDAERGSSIELRLVDQVTPEGTFRNEVSSEGTARIVTRTRAGSITVEQGFRRGDANLDGLLDISDPIHILAPIFMGFGTIECTDAADVDDDSTVNITDAVNLLMHLFLGGPAPRPPYPGCGADPTEDHLHCAAYPLCR
jgi:hypothetical protein